MANGFMRTERFCS